MSHAHGELFDDGLFPMEREASPELRTRYQEPPFTVLDRRSGSWQARDKAWKQLGIQGELGREGGLVFNSPTAQYSNWFDVKNRVIAHHGRPVTDAEVMMEPWVSMLSKVNEAGGTSLYSPTLTELMVRWYSAAGDMILDPFAGGSVRGIVSTTLGREYLGIELSADQVRANRAQGHLGSGSTPTWFHGDALDMDTLLPADLRADFIMTCPPYAYLEEYSDDPRDLSGMSYPQFLEAYREIIRLAVARLHPDRFIAWTIGEVREKGGNGSLLGLVPDTVQAFRDAGCEPYNDHILFTPVGTAAVRSPRQFDTSRKAGRVHEYVHVFVKGDARAATARMGAVS